MNEPTKYGNIHRWIVVLSGALLFFYTYLQMNMLNPIATTLMRDFSINAEQLGTLSAMYFYGNFLMLFVAGLLLDRISTKKLLSLSMLLSIVSIFALANSTHLLTACISRFILGTSAAFAFLGAMRLASRWFSPKQMAFVTGCIVTMGMLGGIVAQTPMEILSSILGWRMSMMIFGFIVIIFLLFSYYIIQDYPSAYKSDKTRNTRINLFYQIRTVIFNKYNWFAGLYVTLMCLPFYLLGALWGSTYLTQIDKVTNIQAADIDSMLFIGLLIGSPLIGWISDRIRLRILPMIVGAMLSLVIILLIIYLLHLSAFALAFLFLLLGIITSTQVIGYPIIAELNSPLLTSSALSISSLLLMASGFICQPLFGWLMELHWDHLIVNNVPIYSLHDFQRAMWIMPIGFTVSLLLVFFIKETHCQAKQL